MTQSQRPIDAEQPSEIDTTEDRMGSVRELDFDVDEPTGRIGDELPEDQLRQELPLEREREAGLTGASTGDHEPTDDDMSPETLIHEDGARSPEEEGLGGPEDEDLSIVDEDEIGGGNGWDEAELARRDPLDGNR